MIQTYEQAATLAKTRKRKLANNTYLVLHNDRFGIRLHETEVVVYHRDGRVTLNSGGWRTITTKSRMNNHLPPGWSIYQTDFIWYLQYQNGSTLQTYPFVDGITIRADHRRSPTVSYPRRQTKPGPPNVRIHLGQLKPLTGWRSCAGRLNQLPGKPCAICGYLTHERGTTP